MTTAHETDHVPQKSTAYRMGVYAWSPGKGGVHHHRIAEPLRVLAQLGVNVGTGVELTDDITDRCDTILVHTLHDEQSSAAWRQLERMDNHRLVLDVDDWMWAPDWKVFKDNYPPDVLDRLFDNIRRAHVVTTPSPVIAEFLVSWNPNVWVVPNTVPEWLLDHPMPERDGPTIGYQGSDSHILDWTQPVRQQLARFLRDHPGWTVHSYGSMHPGDLGRYATVKHTPWSGSVADYYRSVSMDIGIGPLRDTPFNRAKSSLRAVEYAALGVVAVLPDLPPYRGWVQDGVTGRLIRSGQTMRGVLAQLAADWPAVEEMSVNARERAMDWTTEACIGKWVEAWNSQS
jgi:glycosyltransferase involved in cell wall biosynthesis